MSTGFGYYPADEDEGDEDPKGLTVRFPHAELEDYKLIARLWNELDRVRGVKRRHKWKPTSVLRHAARLLRAQIRERNKDWPATADDQEEFLRKKVAEMEREMGKKPKK